MHAASVQRACSSIHANFHFTSLLHFTLHFLSASTFSPPFLSTSPSYFSSTHRPATRNIMYEYIVAFFCFTYIGRIPMKV